MDLKLDQGDLLSRLLSASVRRQETIMTNIANANTPGYTRKVLRFEELLREAVGRDSDLARIDPRLESDVLTPARPDGNNVSLELEINALRENKLLYETYAAILNAKFELVRSSIESGR